ncbi:hypothetical protein OMR07_14060, partial [Methylobacterium organophilum]|nr:hypothetical protein [Methylobacterium organophilum]
VAGCEVRLLAEEGVRCHPSVGCPMQDKTAMRGSSVQILIRRCSNEALLSRSLPIQCVRTHGPEYKGIEAERVVLPADDEQTLTGLIGKHQIPVLVRKR